MKRALVGLAIVSALATGGCAPTVLLTYHSDPEGATLTANQTRAYFGVTPIALKYRLPAKGCLATQPVFVKWNSGAETFLEGLTICPEGGRQQIYTFQRPNVPGREQDAEFAAALVERRWAELRAEQAPEEARRSVPLMAAAARPERPGPGVSLLLFGGDNHETFLGCLNCSEFDASSVLNRFGLFGSRLAADSIFNRFGQFGGRFSAYSPCNPYTATPPVIVDDGGTFYGTLTMNRYNAQRTRITGLNEWLAGVCAAS